MSLFYAFTDNTETIRRRKVLRSFAIMTDINMVFHTQNVRYFRYEIRYQKNICKLFRNNS